MTLRFVAARFVAAPPRIRALLVGGAGAAALLLALADDPLFANAGRATLAALALAAVAWRARRSPATADRRPLIDVADCKALSRDAAIALVRVGGRALLVGYGPGGVRLVAEVLPEKEREAP
jgi:hypothetical protein